MPRISTKYPSDFDALVKRIDCHLSNGEADKTVAASMAATGVWSKDTIRFYMRRAEGHAKTAERLLGILNTTKS